LWREKATATWRRGRELQHSATVMFHMMLFYC
jgi:hypothetical protein